MIIFNIGKHFILSTFENHPLMLYTISLKTNIKKRILINLSLLGPEFKPPDYHHFVLLNKENKTLRIQVLTIDLGTLFVSFLFHELLIRTD